MISAQKKKIILVSLKENLKSSDAENLGAKFFNLFKNSNLNEFNINSDTIEKKSSNLLSYFLHELN